MTSLCVWLTIGTNVRMFWQFAKLIRDFVTPTPPYRKADITSQVFQEQPLLHTLYFVSNNTASLLWEKYY